MASAAICCLPSCNLQQVNRVIKREVIQGRPTDAILAYIRMHESGLPGDNFTYPLLLRAASELPSSLLGAAIHAQTIKIGYANHSFVQTALLNMYSSRGETDDACCLFKTMPHRDLVAWNSMLEAYVCHGRMSEAVELFDAMPLKDQVSFNTMISGFAKTGRVDCAEMVFSKCPVRDTVSWNTMISAYVRAGRIETARCLFEEMPEKNVVSWNTLMAGYVQSQLYAEALELFHHMKARGFEPNHLTFASILCACANMGLLDTGKEIHIQAGQLGLAWNPHVVASLIDMYAKCGSIERAMQVFNGMGDERDVTAWTAMLAGLAMHGRSREGLALFDQMLSRRVAPNAVTFLGVLCACVHGGLVHEGREYFEAMRMDFGIAPLIQHYGCIVDLYGRAGMTRQAWEVANAMPMKPDVLIWGALLSGSRLHGDIEMCELALKNLIELEPLNSGAYVLLSNLYATMGRWADVRQVRGLMEAKGVKKTPGCTMVEVGGNLYEFLVGDKTHPETREIYLILEEIMGRLKAAGYVPNTGEVLLDLDEEGKEAALAVHSEKLAIAFCFLKTEPGTALRIVKNLRVCVDCHAAIKLVSKVYDLEIVVRDCSRFHHFRHGSCSCGDYW